VVEREERERSEEPEVVSIKPSSNIPSIVAFRPLGIVAETLRDTLTPQENLHFFFSELLLSIAVVLHRPLELRETISVPVVAQVFVTGVAVDLCFHPPLFSLRRSKSSLPRFKGAQPALLTIGSDNRSMLSHKSLSGQRMGLVPDIGTRGVGRAGAVAASCPFQDQLPGNMAVEVLVT
jgi:hypothetical protein